jgi:hypothetical protein
MLEVATVDDPFVVSVRKPNEIVRADLRTTEGKMALAEELVKTPQLKANIVHRFGPGIYIREATYSAGTVIMGLEHLLPHTNILLQGSINVINHNEEVVSLTAPYIFTAKPGAKMGYAVTDVIWQNIYATNERDIYKLEQELYNIPDWWKAKQEQELLNKIIEHEEDRQDFILAVKESGWTLSEVETMSNYRGDCVDLPDGSYCFAPDKSPIHGLGLFCSADVSKGHIFAPMRVDGKRTPAGYLVNHSKTPNCIAVTSGKGDLLLVAIKPITGMVGGNLGEELTLDYRQVMRENKLWKGE